MRRISRESRKAASIMFGMACVCAAVMFFVDAMGR